MHLHAGLLSCVHKQTDLCDKSKGENQSENTLLIAPEVSFYMLETRKTPTGTELTKTVT